MTPNSKSVETRGFRAKGLPGVGFWRQDVVSTDSILTHKNDLAKKEDIKYTTLMKVESETVNKPRVQTMAKIAKALGVSIEDLIK